MDFKKVFSGGEPRITNDDLIFMQYSNYYGIQAIADGIDSADNGVIVKGCAVTATFNSLDNLANVSVSNGYIIIKGQMIRVKNTEPLVDVPISFVGGPTNTYNLVAYPIENYNTLGDKTFNDNTTRRTMLEYRIGLELTTSIPTGSIVISTITFTDNSNSVVVTQYANTIGKELIKNVNPTLEMMKVSGKRNGVDTRAVTPESLYAVINDWNIVEYVSTTYNFLEKSFSFTIPDNVIDLQLINAQHTDTASSDEYSQSYSYINWSTKTLKAVFPVMTGPTTCKAYCLVKYNSLS